jgi:rhodanese-related sulfurtransferase
LNPKGIQLIREKAILNWVEDSLFNEIHTDSIASKNEYSESNSEKSVLSTKNIDTSKTFTKKNNKIDSSSVVKNEIQPKKHEVVEFTEPKAIHLEQAYTLFKKGVTFIDARDESDYAAGHIKNSVNIPFEDFDNHKQKLDQLPKDKPIVTYCAGTECDLSILLGNLLFKDGYKQVYVFFGGWVDWSNANYPIEKSNTVNDDK